MEEVGLSIFYLIVLNAYVPLNIPPRSATAATTPHTLKLAPAGPVAGVVTPVLIFARSATAATTPHTLKLAPAGPVAGVVDPGPHFRGQRPRIQRPTP